MKSNQSKLKSSWLAMRQRCTNKSRYYRAWSGKGIKICDEWKDFEVFAEWANSNGYVEGLTIDRIDNNGNYCPENCRWVTKSENSSHQMHLGTCKYKPECTTLEKCTGRVGACTEYHRLASRIYRKSYRWDQREGVSIGA